MFHQEAENVALVIQDPVEVQEDTHLTFQNVQTHQDHHVIVDLGQTQHDTLVVHIRLNLHQGLSHHVIATHLIQHRQDHQDHHDQGHIRQLKKDLLEVETVETQGK